MMFESGVSGPIWALCLTGWVLINAVTFGAFYLDKTFARMDRRRIPERRLLFLALVGGSLGAKTAQRRFRHKTRKQPFGTILNAICVLHGVIVIAAVLMIFRQM